MNKNFIYVGICLVWITGLTVWVVNKFLTSIPTVTVQGISSSAQPQKFAVQMDANRVWVIDTFNGQLDIITHDQNGYHDQSVKIVPNRN